MKKLSAEFGSDTQILLVGSSSNVVSHLKKWLDEKGLAVHIAGRRSNWNVDLSKPTRDLTIPDGITVLVNAAAAFGNETFARTVESTEVNVLGPLKLLEVCERNRIDHLIQISSMFANTAEEDMEASPYAVQKRAADNLLVTTQRHLQSGPLVTCLRPAALYGPGKFCQSHQPFLHDLIRRVKEGEDVSLSAGPNPKRNYLHIEDFCEVVFQVIENRPQGIFDCPGESISYDQIFAKAKKAYNSKSELTKVQDNRIYDNKFLLRNRSIYEEIDFAPKYDFDRFFMDDARFEVRAK